MTLRVLAAMSGGVDSAVAAARVAEAGHDVTGVHLALSKNPQSYRTGARGCCTVEDSHDARRAADVIGIPFYVWDMSEEFDREVVSDFVSEYEAGNTPNPCLRCNEKIKFEAVLDRAIALGFDAVATGHHVRKVDGRLVRSVDAAKDQSYVLGVLTAEQVRHAMFPLGDCTKEEVRAEAERRGLSVADKPDSHDICFIADGDTAGFLNRRLGERPGEIRDEEGNVLGTHRGAHTFTVGQRKGLGLSGSPDPRYVLSIEPVGNTVTVGPRAALKVDGITGRRPVWNGCEPLTEPTECRVQLRAHGEVYPATVRQREGADGPELEVRLAEPATGVATGQAVVVYDGATGDTVLGSATIAATVRAAAAAS
ncbi:tRNA 2-thiouridine(34) synthase MnmA [Nocardiopsis algeriensis]|uniref:tRNA-specific 2-thiouridylase MnmA n=1 Tax=Nocardiopsis algeriensis TaxID=1478215 RepID=A0A841IQ54_9ACTN|nr:tRNA 2-thiouridine(34) synthase MnmA [Nocardiopsis algeriensis]MBB6120304.1 tRNA-specific 2-thiouridylase [Nocardiopsis algeriensis]